MHDSDSNANHQTVDPVCGMTVDPETAKHRHEHDGESYYFCSSGCLSKFTAAPSAYLTDKSAAHTHGSVHGGHAADKSDSVCAMPPSDPQAVVGLPWSIS